MKIVKANLIGDTYLKLLLGFRIATIGGRFGGGKTLLATWLAYWLKENKYVDKIVSNVPVLFNDDDGGNLRRSAILLDESWTYIQTRNDILAYSAYLRKIDSYLLLPSVFDIHYRLSFFRAERQINFQSFGIPVWLYSWTLRKGSGSKDKGSFLLVNPQVMFGTYDTFAIPFDDGGISKRLYSTIEEYANERMDTKSTGRRRVSGFDHDWGFDTSDSDLNASEIAYAGQELRDEIEAGLRSVSKARKNF